MSIVIDRPVDAVIDMRAYAAGATPSGDWFQGRSEPAFSDAAVEVAAFALRGEGQVDRLLTDECVRLLRRIDAVTRFVAEQSLIVITDRARK